MNPQAYKEFQQARKDNVDPNEYLNKVTGNFNDKQRQSWNQMMSNFNQQSSK